MNRTQFLKTQSIQSGMSVTFFSPVLESILKMKTGYFMQDGARAHTTIYSTNVLNKTFEDRPVCQIAACKVYRLKSL
jgi:hypothetical protein